MMERIRYAFQLVHQAMLHNVGQSFKKRIQVCAEERGGYIEHLI